jgi:hypothetical protein
MSDHRPKRKPSRGWSRRSRSSGRCWTNTSPYNGELLSYLVFEGEFLRWFIACVRDGDHDPARRFVAAVEPLLTTDVDPPANDRVWNLAGVCFVEGLVMQGDDDVIGIARPWMGQNTSQDFDLMLRYLKRRVAAGMTGPGRDVRSGFPTVHLDVACRAPCASAPDPAQRASNIRAREIDIGVAEHYRRLHGRTEVGDVPPITRLKRAEARLHSIAGPYRRDLPVTGGLGREPRPNASAGPPVGQREREVREVVDAIAHQVETIERERAATSEATTSESGPKRRSARVAIEPPHNGELRTLRTVPIPCGHLGHRRHERDGASEHDVVPVEFRGRGERLARDGRPVGARCAVAAASQRYRGSSDTHGHMMLIRPQAHHP